MTKNLFRILLFLLLPLAGQAKDADSLRVLWVGNSYTYYNDMPAIVQQIAATQKVKVSCTRFLKGGVLKGQCRYDDNGTEVMLHAGDTAVCPDGEWHAVYNDGPDDMEMVCLILFK